MDNSNRVIWVYNGFPIDDLPGGKEAKQRLFQLIGFEFGTGFNEYDSIIHHHPMVEPEQHLIDSVIKIIAESGVPRAIVVTDIDSGSTINVNREVTKFTSEEAILSTYQKIATELDVPFFYIPREELFKKNN